MKQKNTEKTLEKFSSQLSGKNLKLLRDHAGETNKPIASILDEALTRYFNQILIRPTFIQATDEVLNQHADLLQRLAR